MATGKKAYVSFFSYSLLGTLFFFFANYSSFRAFFFFLPSFIWVLTTSLCLEFLSPHLTFSFFISRSALVELPRRINVALILTCTFLDILIFDIPPNLLFKPRFDFAFRCCAIQLDNIIGANSRRLINESGAQKSYRDGKSNQQKCWKFTRTSSIAVFKMAFSASLVSPTVEASVSV